MVVVGIAEIRVMVTRGKELGSILILIKYGDFALLHHQVVYHTQIPIHTNFQVGGIVVVGMRAVGGHVFKMDHTG